MQTELLLVNSDHINWTAADLTAPKSGLVHPINSTV